MTLPLSGRYLERVWGAQELVKFVVFTIVASNIIAVVVSVIESIVLGNKQLFLYASPLSLLLELHNSPRVNEFRYGMSYHGLEALQVGFLVAFTQLIPEHQVQMFGGILKMRVKVRGSTLLNHFQTLLIPLCFLLQSLPMLYVTFSNIACLLGYQSPYILVRLPFPSLPSSTFTDPRESIDSIRMVSILVIPPILQAFRRIRFQRRSFRNFRIRFLVPSLHPVCPLSLSSSLLPFTDGLLSIENT